MTSPGRVNITLYIRVYLIWDTLRLLLTPFICLTLVFDLVPSLSPQYVDNIHRKHHQQFNYFSNKNTEQNSTVDKANSNIQVTELTCVRLRFPAGRWWTGCVAACCCMLLLVAACCWPAAVFKHTLSPSCYTTALSLFCQSTTYEVTLYK